MANNDLSRPHFFEQGKSSRTLLLLHGTGADEYDLISLGKAIDPDASVLSPRGMHLEAGMNRFFARFPDGTFDEESIDVAVEDLSGFIRAAVVEYGFDAENLFAVGFSNGANAAAALMLKYPELLSGGALFGSTRPYAKVNDVDLTGKVIWLANGDQDPYAPVATSEIWVNQLRGFGAEVSWLRHAGGHQISSEHVQIIHDSIQ
jgi:predicted esterase